MGYLSGRDAAARLGRPSASALRAESWDNLPIVRMVNVNLEPGEGSLADLIAGVDDGVLLDVNKSWSIDDPRLNFQFGCEIAYAIEGGRLTGRIYKNPVYTGVTPKFWGGCSGIAGPDEARMWGWSYCGKGDPVQLMYVGHGCAPARFEGVNVRAPPRRGLPGGGRPAPARGRDDALHRLDPRGLRAHPRGGVRRDLEPHTTFDEECFVCPPLLIRGLHFTSGR